MKLSEKVLRVLRGEKISEAELREMLQDAVITSVRGFNMRYFHWLFRMQGDNLEAMEYADLPSVGKGVTKMLEDHESCRGQGCRGCGWSGQIARWITDKPLAQHETGPQYLRRRAS
jgi:hypothetical protein